MMNKRRGTENLFYEEREPKEDSRSTPVLEGQSAASWHQDSFSISFQECFKSRGDSLHTLLITPCTKNYKIQMNRIEILENWGLGYQSAFCVWF